MTDLKEIIVLANPDGSSGQLHTDIQGNLCITPANIFGSLTCPPVGKVVNAVAFTWSNGLMVTATFKDASSATLFTLTFTWNSDGTLASIIRS